MRSLISFVRLAITGYLLPLAGAVALPAHRLLPRSQPGTSSVTTQDDRPNAFHLGASTRSTSIAAVPRGGGGKAVTADDEGNALAKFAASVRSAVDNLLVRLGLKQDEIPTPPVEKPSIRSTTGTVLSVIGALVALESVIELACGNAELFLQLDGASLLIAVLASALSKSDVACIINRGVITLSILLGSMHLLTV